MFSPPSKFVIKSTVSTGVGLKLQEVNICRRRTNKSEVRPEEDSPEYVVPTGHTEVQCLTTSSRHPAYHSTTCSHKVWDCPRKIHLYIVAIVFPIPFPKFVLCICKLSSMLANVLFIEDYFGNGTPNKKTTRK